MGKVSVADDTLLGRTVALKELLVPSPSPEARFQRELALTARLQHPAIVSIHDAGSWPNGEPFYVMRLVTGTSLERLIAEEAERDRAGRAVAVRDRDGRCARVGNVQLATGDAAGALLTFRAGQRVIQRIGVLAPTNIDVKRDLQISASRVGEALDATGDHAGALVEYRAELAIAMDVATREPSAITRSDLAMAYNDLGGALEAAGDRSGALAQFRAGDQLAKEIVERDPSNGTMKRQRWAFLANISELTLEGDPVAALAQLREGAAIVKELAAREPSNVEVRGDYALSRIRIGAALASTGDNAGAVIEDRAAIALCAELAAADPETRHWHELLATATSQLAAAQRTTN
jgi:tetratricopeptide (TPR) repeat protein